MIEHELVSSKYTVSQKKL